MESLKIQCWWIRHMRLENNFLFQPSTIFLLNKNSLVNSKVYIKFTIKMSKKKREREPWHRWMTKVEVTLEAIWTFIQRLKLQLREFKVSKNSRWKFWTKMHSWLRWGFLTVLAQIILFFLHVSFSMWGLRCSWVQVVHNSVKNIEY